MKEENVNISLERYNEYLELKDIITNKEHTPFYVEDWSYGHTFLRKQMLFYNIDDETKTIIEENTNLKKEVYDLKNRIDRYLKDIEKQKEENIKAYEKEDEESETSFIKNYKVYIIFLITIAVCLWIVIYTGIGIK